MEIQLNKLENRRKVKEPNKANEGLHDQPIDRKENKANPLKAKLLVLINEILLFFINSDIPIEPRNEITINLCSGNRLTGIVATNNKELTISLCNIPVFNSIEFKTFY